MLCLLFSSSPLSAHFPGSVTQWLRWDLSDLHISHGKKNWIKDCRKGERAEWKIPAVTCPFYGAAVTRLLKFYSVATGARVSVCLYTSCWSEGPCTWPAGKLAFTERTNQNSKLPTRLLRRLSSQINLWLRQTRAHILITQQSRDLPLGSVISSPGVRENGYIYQLPSDTPQTQTRFLSFKYTFLC